MDEQKAVVRKNGAPLPERRLLSRAAAGLLCVVVLSSLSCAKSTPEYRPEENFWVYFTDFLTHNWFIISVISVVIVAIVLLAQMRRAQKERSLQRAEKLTEKGSESLASIGPLLNALYSPDSEHLDALVMTLVRLLPQLNASDAGLLNFRQRALLHRTLSHSDSRLVYAALAALEHIGDQHSLRAIEQLERTPMDDKVRLAAGNCRTAITAREELSNSQKTLLRPAASTVEPSETLLRPAQGSATTGAVQLLRASGDVSGGIDPRD
jgi:hypothetical protein